jgi:hypothetical protein
MSFITTDMTVHEPYASGRDMWEVFFFSKVKEELRNNNIEFKSHGGNTVMAVLSTENIVFYCVRFEVFTAMTMQETVFWDLAPCILVRTYVSEERIASIIRTGVRHLLIYSHRDSPALMMEAIRSSETSVLTKIHGARSQKTVFLYFTDEQ